LISISDQEAQVLIFQECLEHTGYPRYRHCYCLHRVQHLSEDQSGFPATGASW